MLSSIQSSTVETVGSSFVQMEKVNQIAQKQEEETESKSVEFTLHHALKTDTVTISSEGAAYAQQHGAEEGNYGQDMQEKPAASKTSSDDSVKHERSAAAVESNVSSVLSSVTDSEEGDSDDTSDLSSYSTAELARLMANGDITPAEYKAELESRQGVMYTEE